MLREIGQEEFLDDAVANASTLPFLLLAFLGLGGEPP